EAAWIADAAGKPLGSAAQMRRVQIDASSLLARGLPRDTEFWTRGTEAYIAARAHSAEGDLIVGRHLPKDFLGRHAEIESQINAFHAEWSQIATFKNQILLTLSLLTILLLFAATWTALHL